MIAPDLVPVANRLGRLQWIRLAMAGMVVVAVVTLPGSVDDGGGLLLASGGYLALTALGGFAHVASRARAHTLRSALLLVDGVWIGFVLDGTGGPVGALAFLVPLHVVAASLLLSHRTGLKVAIWHALLLGVAVGGGTSEIDPRTLAFAATAYLLVASVVAWCSSLNERALRRNSTVLGGLVALGTELERASGVDDVLVALCTHTSRRLGFARAALVSDPGGGSWTGAAVGRNGVAVLASGESFLDLTDRGESGVILVRELDASAHPELAALLPDAANVIVLPLLAEGRRVAVLAAEWGSAARNGVPSSTVTALNQSATQTALALRNATLRVEIERLATRDGLTGLANRRVFDESLLRAVAGADRSGSPLSLVVFDLDHFKAVNDLHGHQVGDEVLRVVGRVLAETVRDADLAARYGGEELALLCPDTAADAALALAERVRTAVAEASTPVPVTISAGVATTADDAVTPEALVGAADAALYESKRRGRDRSTAAGELARRRARPLQGLRAG